ncbi:16119_t:CDS:2, partial [Acaulospora morrowiae]
MGSESIVLPALEVRNVDKLIIYSGNLMKQANINSIIASDKIKDHELISSLEEVLSANPSQVYDHTHGVIEISGSSKHTHKPSDERDDHEIT